MVTLRTTSPARSSRPSHQPRTAGRENGACPSNGAYLSSKTACQTSSTIKSTPPPSVRPPTPQDSLRTPRTDTTLSSNHPKRRPILRAARPRRPPHLQRCDGRPPQKRAPPAHVPRLAPQVPRPLRHRHRRRLRQIPLAHHLPFRRHRHRHLRRRLLRHGHAADRRRRRAERRADAAVRGRARARRERAVPRGEPARAVRGRGEGGFRAWAASGHGDGDTSGRLLAVDLE